MQIVLVWYVCGSAEYDECGVCAGDDSLCNQQVALYQTVSVEEDGSVQIVLEATDPNEDDLIFELVSLYLKMEILF